MIILDQVPSNSDDADRYVRWYASGRTQTEFGLAILIRRMCESVIAQSASGVQVHGRETWICIDRQQTKRERSSEGRPFVSFQIDFLTKYHLRSPASSKRNDFFTLNLYLRKPKECGFYTDDRLIFADRLLRKTAECWESSCKLYDEVSDGSLPSARWPVRLWIYNQPERIWAISETGSLVELSDQPPVDESILDLTKKEPAPGTPQAIYAEKSSLPIVLLRWPAVPDARYYVFERDVDGQPFVFSRSVRDEAALPDADGWCHAIDRWLPASGVLRYRVRAIRGPGSGSSSDYSPVTSIDLLEK